MLPKFPGDAPRDLSRPLEQVKVLIDSRLDGLRLDVALTTVLTWRSRASIHRLIDGGLVQLNGRLCSKVLLAKLLACSSLISSTLCSRCSAM